MRTQKDLNPFSDSFDQKRVMKLLSDITNTKELQHKDLGIFLTAVSSIRLNAFFKDIYDGLKAIILGSATETNLLMERLIALTNRHYQLIKKAAEDEDISVESYFEDSFKGKIPSSDPSIGMIDSISAMETEIDALHTSLNFIRYFNGKILESFAKTEVSYVEDCRSISKWSSIFYGVKHCFDDCVWNDGQMVYGKKSGEFHITYESPENLRLNRAGFYRLMRNVQGIHIMLLEQYQESDNNFRILFLFGSRKKQIRISEASHKDGYLFYSLESGNDEVETYFELYNKASLEAYYNYIDNIVLPNVPSLTLNDLICMLSLIQHLIRRIVDQCKDSEVMSREDFNKFPLKIEYSKLKNYLLERSTYTPEQILDFIELLTNKQDKRINFWDYPFLISGEALVFPLLTISDPILLYLIDRWLEDGGYDLDKRGKYFEDYIKNSIARILTRKKYFFAIPTSPNIYNASGQWEEIDLLLNLKDVVIIGEVKCITYPMEARDYHNGLAQLTSGSEQVNRKAAFLLQHADELISQIGVIKGKEVIKLVITNYPIYTGYLLNGVAVVDYFHLEAYLSSGRITGNMITTEEGKISTIETSEIVLQASEDELNANFKSNMYMPKSVEQVLQLIELTNNKITPEGLNFQIYAQSAGFKS